MERREFIVATLIFLVAGTGWAQESTKHYRLGIISAGNPRSTAFYAAFDARLREMWWIEGGNLTVDFEAGRSSEQLSRSLRAWFGKAWT